MKKKRWRMALGAALSLSMVVAVSPATAAPPEAAPPADRLAKFAESIDHLRSTYGISAGEALRRLDVQRDAPAIEQALLGRFPNDFAGMWLDQPNGGVLVIRMVRPGLMNNPPAELDAVNYRVEGAKWSLTELRATRDRLEAAGTPTALSFVVDEQRNVVMAYDWSTTPTERAATTRTRMSFADEQGQVVDAPDQSAVKADHGDWLTAEDTIVGTEPTEGPELPEPPDGAAPAPQACDFLSCGPPPMRGGFRLKIPRDNGSNGYCTNGFNVKGSNGFVYTLTAGHCVLGPNHTKRDRSSHNNVAVGYELDATRNPTYPLDYAIMPYQNPPGAGYWLPANKAKNIVYSQCRADSPRTGCRNGNIGMVGIHGYDAIRVGWVVCHTGSATPDYGGRNWLPGTRCGQVTVKDGGIRTNLCSRPTDSGGPLFSQIDNRGYGILTGGSPAQGECTTREYSRFSPLSKVFADAELHSRIRMSLIT